MKDLSIPSPAKINLHLQVLGKRPDGYHNIETLFLKVPLEDTLRVSLEGEGFTLMSRHPQVPRNETNTMVKAYKLLEQRVGKLPGIRVSLDKRIPLGGGLGGGSSNAAILLTALNQLLDLGLSREDLMEIGRRVGADVPFFMLDAPAALARGKGDRLEPLKSRLEGHLVLVMPPLSVSTSWAYSSLVFPLTPPCTNINILALLLERGDLAGLAPRVFNHLEGPVFGRFPLLKHIKEELLKRGASIALMSGSGSTVFGIFEAEEPAEGAARWASGMEWEVCLAPLIRG